MSPYRTIPSPTVRPVRARLREEVIATHMLHFTAILVGACIGQLLSLTWQWSLLP